MPTGWISSFRIRLLFAALAIVSALGVAEVLSYDPLMESSIARRILLSELDGYTPPHTRPLFYRDGQRLLWSNYTQNGRTDFFDVTDALLDPNSFQYGIGKDAISSIEQPAFVDIGTAEFDAINVDEDTDVIGVFLNGEARAYPVIYLNRHELVNDVFGDAYVTVGW